MQATLKQRIARDAELAIVKADIGNIPPALPIQPHRIRQRNPMFRPVGRVLSLIPLKLHDRHIGAILVTNPLTGGRS